MLTFLLCLILSVCVLSHRSMKSFQIEHLTAKVCVSYNTTGRVGFSIGDKFFYCGSLFHFEFGVMRPTEESWSRSQVALKQVCTTDSAIT